MLAWGLYHHAGSNNQTLTSTNNIIISWCQQDHMKSNMSNIWQDDHTMIPCHLSDKWSKSILLARCTHVLYSVPDQAYIKIWNVTARLPLLAIIFDSPEHHVQRQICQQTTGVITTCFLCHEIFRVIFLCPLPSASNHISVKANRRLYVQYMCRTIDYLWILNIVYILTVIRPIWKHVFKKNFELPLSNEARILTNVHYLVFQLLQLYVQCHWNTVTECVKWGIDEVEQVSKFRQRNNMCLILS